MARLFSEEEKKKKKTNNMTLTSRGDWLQQPKLMSVEAADCYCSLNIRAYVGIVKD